MIISIRKEGPKMKGHPFDEVSDSPDDTISVRSTISENKWKECNIDSFYLRESLFQSRRGVVWRARLKKDKESMNRKIMDRTDLVLKERKGISELGGEVAVHHEADLLLSLRHSSIIHCFGYFYTKTNNSTYIILEFAPRLDLATLMSQRKDSSSVIHESGFWSAATQLLSGLRYIHKSGIVHRDIKPSNVLVMKDGTYKIADFGVAKRIYKTKSNDTLTLTHRTSKHVGTRSYFSPEITTKFQYSAASDVYALGVTFYELLTNGEKPFSNSNRVNAFSSESELVDLDELAAQLRLWNPYISISTSRWVTSLLHPSPSHRPTTKQLLETAKAALNVILAEKKKKKKSRSAKEDDMISKGSKASNHSIYSNHSSMSSHVSRDGKIITSTRAPFAGGHGSFPMTSSRSTHPYHTVPYIQPYAKHNTIFKNLTDEEHSHKNDHNKNKTTPRIVSVSRETFESHKSRNQSHNKINNSKQKARGSTTHENIKIIEKKRPIIEVKKPTTSKVPSKGLATRGREGGGGPRVYNIITNQWT